MRLTKITLRNFRGVANVTVNFGPGVTVIDGPNEAGKSSIAHAITFIRDIKATSRHRDIIAAQPIGRDVGPEVELELTTGGYDLTYRKRWLKAPITELTVREPKPEQLSGDTAHDRFLGILADTVDLDLLVALDVLQGKSLDQPDLARISSLHRALDDSAADLDEHDALMERVDTEYGKYFTATGKATGAYKSATDALPLLDAAVESLKEHSAEMNHFVDDHARFAAALVRTELELQAAKTDLANRGEEDAAFAALRQAIKFAEQEVDEANRIHLSATDALEIRSGLLSEVEARKKVWEDGSASVVELTARHQEAQSAFEVAKATVAEIEGNLFNTHALARTAALAVERKRTHTERKEFSDRVARAQAAEDQRLAALAELEIANIDEAALANLTALATEVRVAEGARSAAAARVIVVRTGSTNVTVEGNAVSLDEHFEMPAIDTVHVEVDGLALIEVRPGTAPAELDQALGDAHQALTNALTEANVATLEEARQVAGRRRTAESDLSKSNAAVSALLGDLTLDSVIQRLAVVEARIALDPTPEPAEELSELELLVTPAAEAEAALADELKIVQDNLEQRRKAVDDTRDEEVRAHASLDAAKDEFDRVAESLAAGRLLQEELLLEDAVSVAAEDLAKKQVGLLDAQESLDSADPETFEMLAANARELVTSKETELKDTRTRVDQLNALLQDREAEGIYDKLASAEAALEAGRVWRDRQHRAAEAIGLLRSTLLAHRAEAQKKYVAPFKEQIERLGRVVFGRDFQVEVSSDLTIESRTLSGTTVPFASLSTGAREQLSLLGRLACAQIVDPDDGAPVLLDDALGFSDPDRLLALNAVLGEVGRSAQVVVLTCQPARFSSVGGAEVAHLVAS